MPGRIRDEDIAAVRDKVAIDEVIGEHVQLRSAGGGNLKGLCPFHDEKSPSFTVTPARSMYYCFGCGEGGDAIRFVERVEHLSFADAVERLASRAGIQLRYEDGGSAAGPARGQRSRLIEAHVLAAAFYADQLASAEAAVARQFLDQRGFDSTAAKQFGCGFAPSGWDSLTKYLLGRGFQAAELTLAGLSRESGRGSLIDRFHRRLLWPISDVSGDVVGFGARRLFDDDKVEAKYLNTPDTPIYKKSQLLYGLDVAKREIAKAHRAVIVEGYTDVMACHLAGVPTAIATCGTAFGTEHVALLRRLLLDSDVFTGEVIFTFDGDAAGMRAAERAFGDDQKFMAQTFVAIEPTGKDPCELRQAAGDLAVAELVNSRRPLVDFVLATVVARHNLETAEGRVAALNQGMPLIVEIKDLALRDEYARRLAGMVGVDDPNRVVSTVRSMVTAASRRSVPAGVASRGQGARPAAGGGAQQSVAGGSTRGGGAAGAYAGRPRTGTEGHGAVQARAPQTGGIQAGTEQAGAASSGRADAQQTATSPALTAEPVVTVPAGVARAEREALKAALQLPAAATGFDDLADTAFLLPVHRAVRQLIRTAGGVETAPTGAGWVSAVLQQLPDDSPLRSPVQSLAVEPLLARAAEQQRYAAAVVRSIAELLIGREIAADKSRLQRAEAAGDSAEVGRLQRELQQQEQQRRLLMARDLQGEAS